MTDLESDLMIANAEIKRLRDAEEWASTCEVTNERLICENEQLRDAQRWIPVSERLPEASGAYWVNLHQEDEDGNDADFCIEAWYQVNHLLFAPKEVGWQLLNEWYEFSGQMRQYISHWRPLPAPPKESRDD